MNAPVLTGLLLGLAVLVLGLPSEGRVLLARTGSRPGTAAVGSPSPADGSAPALCGRVLDGTAPLTASRWAVLVLTALAAAVVLGPAPAVGAVGVVLLTRRVLTARRRAAADDGERRRATEACAALAGELRAGRSLADALDAAARFATGTSGALLAEASASARVGGGVPAVLQRTVPSAVPQLLTGLAVCWQVCARSGSGLAAAVERLAEGCREQEDQRRAVDAALAGPRATAGLLALLPLGGIGLAAALGADPVHVLLRTPAGLVCLVLGVALDGAGLAWTRRLAARAAR